MFIERLLDGRYLEFFGWIFAVMFSVCLHEYAHALVAHKLGDDTAARKGHLSLNPMIQMGPISLVMLLFIGLAWGSVPVNPAILRRHKYGEAMVSFAGPLTNLLLSIVSGVVMGIMIRTGSGADIVMEFLWLFCMLNAVLFLLNMIPCPPLDGYTVLEGFVPKLREFSPESTRQIGFYIVLIIIFSPIGNFLWTGGAAMARAFISLAYPGG